MLHIHKKVLIICSDGRLKSLQFRDKVTLIEPSNGFIPYANCSVSKNFYKLTVCKNKTRLGNDIVQPEKNY